MTVVGPYSSERLVAVTKRGLGLIFHITTNPSTSSKLRRSPLGTPILVGNVCITMTVAVCLSECSTIPLFYDILYTLPYRLGGSMISMVEYRFTGDLSLTLRGKEGGK